jgi:hypothetical protein
MDKNTSEDRAKINTSRAVAFVLSQGYSQETATSFAAWALDYAPEVQGFGNLFDYYVDTLTP